MTPGNEHILIIAADKEEAKNFGFTLIELSIVILILGLLISGVMVGSDLIESAKLRKVVKFYGETQTAVNTFKSKYGQKPGDIYQPSQFGLTQCDLSQGNGGNGDGFVGANSAAGYPYVGYPRIIHENLLFWRHMAEANLLQSSVRIDSQLSTGPCNTFTINDADTLAGYIPRAPIETGYFYLAQRYNIDGYIQGLNLSSFGYPVSHIYNGGAMTSFQAQDIDTKFDDGLPKSGLMYAYGAFTGIRDVIHQSGFSSNGCGVTEYTSVNNPDFYCQVNMGMKELNY